MFDIRTPQPKDRSESMLQTAEPAREMRAHVGIVTAESVDDDRGRCRMLTCSNPYSFHTLRDCQAFQELPVEERFKIVEQDNRCKRCLSFHPEDKGGPPGKICDASQRPDFKTALCHQRKCRRSHHMLLHDNKRGQQMAGATEPPEVSAAAPPTDGKWATVACGIVATEVTADSPAASEV